MHGKADVLGRPRDPHPEDFWGRTAARAADTEEASCPAYTYLRGAHERALAVEFRLRTGDREFFPYGLLGPWRYNPSVGLLLRFAGDAVSLVLVRGSNLDAVVNDAVNLTDRGFQRHRILSVREMDGDELRRAGPGEPTVDRIEVAEFDSADDVRAWLKATAPAFVREQAGS